MNNVERFSSGNGLLVLLLCDRRWCRFGGHEIGAAQRYFDCCSLAARQTTAHLQQSCD